MVGGSLNFSNSEGRGVYFGNTDNPTGQQNRTAVTGQGTVSNRLAVPASGSSTGADRVTGAAGLLSRDSSRCEATAGASPRSKIPLVTCGEAGDYRFASQRKESGSAAGLGRVLQRLVSQNVFRRSVFARIAAILFALLFLLAAIEYFLITRLWQTAIAEREQVLQWGVADDVAEQLGTLTRERLASEEFARRIADMHRVNPRIDIYVLDESGAVLFPKHPLLLPGKVDLRPIREFLAPIPNRRLPLLVADPAYPSNLVPFAAAQITVDGGLGYLYTILENFDYNTSLKGVESKYVTFGGLFFTTLVVLCTFLLGIALFGRASKRLRAVVAAVHAFAEGEREARVATSGDDEISRLGNEFNQMANAIAGHVEALRQRDELRRELLAGIAHDVGAPLSIVGNQLERLSTEVSAGAVELSGDEPRNRLRSAQLGVAALRRLLQQLRDLAMFDNPDVRLATEEFSIADLISEEILPRFQGRAAERSIELGSDLEEPLPRVIGDPALLERVIGNLVENALCYAGAGARVELRVRPLESDVEVAVTDTGKGIPPEEQEKIFDRFYRGTTASDHQGGTGLGLVIVKQILGLHGQQIRVESEIGRGTTFSFRLTRAGRQQRVNE